MSTGTNGRRKFLRGGAAMLVAAPLSSHLAFAQQQDKKIDENAPQAKAVNYRHDASQVKDPKRQKDQFCHNCQLFQSDQKEGWGPCALFGGQLVAAKGWCNAWVKKA